MKQRDGSVLLAMSDLRHALAGAMYQIQVMHEVCDEKEADYRDKGDLPKSEDLQLWIDAIRDDAKTTIEKIKGLNVAAKSSQQKDEAA